MKKSLLFMLFALLYTVGSAQVVFYVEPPSSLEGNYSITFADSTGTGDWGVGDLTNPLNAVVGAELAMALDGSLDADSLVCEPPVVSDVDGKVAVLYRGACEFGAKALAAETAGAVAVVIINHSGAPIEMGGGADGPTVTIPVVMISTADGALLRDAILDGGLTCFIGNKTGFYDNDIGIKSNHVLRAPQASSIQLLSQDDTEFDVELGVWITNFGNNDQTGVTLSADIMFDGGSVYSETSAAVSLPSGDSVYVSLPTFSQTTYDLGMYEMTYSIASDSSDEFNGDNMFLANFRMSENTYSYAEVADEDAGPSNVKYTSPAAPNGEVHSCIHFMDPNASRVNATGLTFSTSTFGEGLDGEVVFLYAYEWSLEFEDLDDEAYTGIDESDLDLLASAAYEYVGDDESGLNVYLDFEDIVELEDDIRYLFCIASESEFVRYGHDVTKVDYSENLEQYAQPINPNSDGAEWFAAGFGLDWISGIAVNMIDANSVGVEENAKNINVTPYPNPAVDHIQVILGNNIAGPATLQIFDINGKLVRTENLSLVPNQLLDLEVADLDGGVYNFAMRYANGDVSNFRVVLTK